MDISPAAAVNAAVQLRQVHVAQEVQLAVLKKAIDAQAAGALTLLQALPPPQPLATSGHLGTRLNVFA